MTIAYYGLRAHLRNRATMAFGFLFPVVFVTAFGLIGGGGLNVSVGIPIVQQSGPIYQALLKIKAVKIESGSQKELEAKLKQGRLGGVLILDESKTPFGLTLLVSSANVQQAAGVQSLVSGVVDKINLNLSGVNDPPLKIKIEEISGRTFRYIDFALPGLIGLALLATSVTATAFGLIFLKKTLVLKRLFVTPIKGSTIILGQGVARLIIVLAQTLVILGIGIFVYHFSLVHGLVTLGQILILSTIGLIAFLGFGLFVAGIASDENTVVPVANLIALPQFLMAGTFFPIDILPPWVQPIAKALPLAFFNTAMRKITIEGLTFDHLIPQLLGLSVWGIIAYVAAARTFRWE